MQRDFDRYFELLPVLVISLILILADHGRDLVRHPNFGGKQLAVPEQSWEAPRLILR